MPFKFPLTSGNVTRFFVIFNLVLLLALGFMVHNSVNAWLTEKRYAMTDLARATQKRIDAYRFATWQIYENLATSAAGSSPNSSLQETRLRPDVYYLEKTRRKTEALIFGSHDSSTLDMTMRMSSYLDTLWGAENPTWSMYFLNGQDNSLIMISTLPLKDMATRYKESAISSLVDGRRAEMLQQANALDERESFSPLRHFAFQNDHYFTLRTTFNQPGHLATVVAFDLPINDLTPQNMPIENFQLRQDATLPAANDQEESENTQIAIVNPDLEIAATLPSTPLQLVYRVPLTSLMMDTLHNLLWPLLVNLVLFLLSFAGMTLLRQQSLRPSENQSAELDSLRVLNEEIVASLPVGLLVYDFASNRTILSNKIAEHLLPHLNLQKIINMSDQHQGVLQATINNEVYEIRHARSVLSPHTQLFLMRDQDRELLVNKKLQKAQQVLDRNHQMRQQLLQNLGHALNRPLEKVVAQLVQLSQRDEDETVLDLLDQSQSLARLVDDIVLLNRLEAHDWSPDASVFSLQELLDEIALESLPLMRRKGLSLVVNNLQPNDEQRFGDRRALRKVLATLMHYALTTTRWGKISLTVSADEARPERLMIELVDTGAGLTVDELANADFPFLGETSQDRYGQASGMAFFLCKQLCKQMGGSLDIIAKPDIGTRYSIQLPLAVEPQTEEEEEKLLDGVTALIEIEVEDVYKIVCRHLENWGARCLSPEERLSGQEHDVLVTDDPARLSGWALLLAEDELGHHALNDRQYRVNFNLSNALQDALLALIEQQLAHDSMEESTEDEELTPLLSGGYFQLFTETVPPDVKRLYTESAEKDYAMLAQTAHRLKGVFAMLNLTPGKQLCEELEQHIKACDDSNITNTTSAIDAYVNELLQQGNQ
ncbi:MULTISPECIES: phosphotransferase RcsD [Pantoea]|uniref:Phosphotransferase RcsD n=1 Tax=Pantoea piersonii TaxID=2364647 RepID=A0AAJ5QPG6_9GAMM|nr:MULTISPECIES: phosphotransferase RcsD [Pantoea]MBZ6400616.1 phosphotransferase RcsD [Pantoea piersonii]MBZ6409842.1 phosphotransferase RcsD [Pantoea piersonii]MBZ6429127.1 phosphotransferase RcsD [Pantoea piersonii]MCG7388601.1 phosphotransferase RcsD [Pantoea sp. ACRSB]NYB00681.1 phosphotransferase RcsD [Pantoea piersonii]